MGLETFTFITSINPAWPLGASDDVAQGDDHLRGFKAAVVNSFPNINGAVNFTPTEANRLVGLTGLTGTGNLVASASPTFTGTAVFATINATTVNATTFAASGAVTGASVTASGTITAALFSGSGASLTNVSPSAGIAAGTLAAGVKVNDANWSGTALAVANGGTGSTTAANARTALGVTATGADTTYAFRANNLSDLGSASSARANLGVTATGADTTYNARANNLSDVAAPATARTNLGLGSIATKNVTVSTANPSGTPADGDVWLKYTP